MMSRRNLTTPTSPPPDGKVWEEIKTSSTTGNTIYNDPIDAAVNTGFAADCIDSLVTPDMQAQIKKALSNRITATTPRISLPQLRPRTTYQYVDREQTIHGTPSAETTPGVLVVEWIVEKQMDISIDPSSGIRDYMMQRKAEMDV
ncbi:hypothetical protein ColLi_12177 [Colletotrichum liriopes]|uniref:Uncharacterized protein n=1 Tax=Colletotrichum liriopes TaxID=708192 RepID=A0AA37GXW3_9PEZI|nr:hypothetical protein ColLi_12177 [Colletotrichum liriopes]